MALTRHTANSSRYLLLTCDEIIRLYPDSLEVITYMGLLYSQHQQNDKAIETISNFINASPRRCTPYFIRCAFYLFQDKYDQAKRDYLRGLRFQNRTDKNFQRKFSDEVIEKSTIDNQEELDSIVKIADAALDKQVTKFSDLITKSMRDARAMKKSKREILKSLG